MWSCCAWRDGREDVSKRGWHRETGAGLGGTGIGCDSAHLNRTGHPLGRHSMSPCKNKTKPHHCPNAMVFQTAEEQLPPRAPSACGLPATF